MAVYAMVLWGCIENHQAGINNAFQEPIRTNSFVSEECDGLQCTPANLTWEVNISNRSIGGQHFPALLFIRSLTLLNTGTHKPSSWPLAFVNSNNTPIGDMTGAIYYISRALSVGDSQPVVDAAMCRAMPIVLAKYPVIVDPNKKGEARLSCVYVQNGCGRGLVVGMASVLLDYNCGQVPW